MKQMQTQGQKQVQKLSQKQAAYMEVLRKNADCIEEELDEQAKKNPELLKKTENKKPLSEKYDRYYNDALKMIIEFDPANTGAQGIVEAAAEKNIQTLENYLLEKLKGVAAPDRTLKLASKIIIHILEDDGSLPYPPDRICEKNNIDRHSLEKALELIRGIEPYGAGTENMRMCILYQLEKNKKDDGLCYIIIRDCWDLLGKVYGEDEAATGSVEEKTDKAAAAIAKRLYRDVKEVKDALTALNHSDTANPFFWKAFSASTRETEYIRPEAHIYTEDGEVKIEMSRAGDNYRMKEDAVKEYIRKADDAGKKEARNIKEMMRMIKERENTINRIVEIIVERHKEHFLDESKPLNRLTQQEVADEIGIHNSTVSRAAAGKHIRTPSGYQEMKKYFVRGKNGEMSKEEVKDIVKQYIRQEPPDKPFTDEEISNRLKVMDIKAARRTVAKYREQLGIEPAGVRRKR